MHTRTSFGSASSRAHGRKLAVAAAACIASLIALATPAFAATYTDNTPCTTILTTTSTKASVFNSSCNYAQPGITRYYAGGPVTYWGALAPTGTSRSVTNSNGTCINHQAAWFYIAGSGIHNHSGC